MDGVWLDSPAAEITLHPPGGGGVNLNDKGRVRIWMNQDRGSDEGLFQEVEGLCGRWCPGQWFGLVFEEVGDRAGYGAIILDEPPIEISET